MQVPPPREASLKKVLLAVLIGILALMGFLTCTFVVVGVTGGFDSEPSASEVIVPISPIPENVAEPTPTQDPTRVVARTPTATPTSVPRPTSTSTPTPLATATALPIPAPTLAPLGARPTVTPHPTPTPSTGLGISSRAIVNRFLEFGDFDIERDGTVASIYSYDGTFQVGLFGPQNNISEASAIVRVTGDTSLIENSLFLVVLMNTITSWDPNDALEWLGDAIEQVANNPDRIVSKRYGGYLLELLFYPPIGALKLDITR